MKNLKVLFTVLCVACATAVWGEGSETFEKIENKTSYTANLSWEGVNGLTWKASTFRTDQKITGNRGLTAKASTACTITMPLTTEQQSAGMGTFSFKYKYPYSDSGKSNNLSFTINSKTYTGSVSYSANEQTVEISVNESTLPSSITINIASGGRACFDDFSWTSFSGSTKTTPSITQQPNNATYDQGAKAAALTITASGNPTPTYQWYSNTSKDNSNGTEISGATEASYTPSTATAGTFYYYCVATNSEGSASSNVATITVNRVKTYTVLWSLGGDEYDEGNPTTSVKSGERVTTLPTPPDGNAIGSCANTFMGWSTHDLGTKKGQSAPTDLFTTAESSPVITQNTIFYAVFATKQNGN